MNAQTLSRLVSSRICHDLISPVGAIGNGLELLQSPGGGEEEISLIADCADAAKITLGFLRIAFGARDDDEMVELTALKSVATPYFARNRIAPDWGDAPDTLTSATARSVLLLAMVAAASLPRGGEMRLRIGSSPQKRIEWEPSGEPLRIAPRIEDLLRSRPDTADLSPGEVHIALLWLAAEDAGLRPFRNADGVIGLA